MLKRQYSWLVNSVSIGLIGGVVAIYLCLVGMVESFNKRAVIEDVLTLGMFLLIAICFVVGLVSSQRASETGRKNTLLTQLVGGTLAGGLTGMFLAGLVAVLSSETFNLRTIFLTASPALLKVLTFDGDTDVKLLYLLYGALIGAIGTAYHFFPVSVRRPLDRAILFCIFMALFSGLFRVVMINQGAEMGKVAKYLFGQTGMTPSGATIFFFSVVGMVAFWNFRGTQIRAGLSTQPKTTQLALRIATILLLAYVVLGLPLVSGPFIAQVIVTVSLYIMMGLGLNITLGFAGLLDLGFVAFFAIGAYTMGLLTSYGPFGLEHFPFWGALPIAVAVSMLAGFALGLPVLGVRGDYLAIATLGFGEIVRILAGSDFLAKYFGGPGGIIGMQKPCIGTLEPFIRADVPRICDGIEIGGAAEFYYIAVAGAVLIAFIASRLRESRLGRAWMAIREDEDVAEALGVNLIQTKLLAYILGAAFAGLSGAIFSVQIGSIFASSMVLDVSIKVIALIIIGGMGSIPGVVVGAIVLIGLPELLREVSEFRFLFYGILLIVMMIARPEGILPSTITQREFHKVAESAPAGKE